MMRAQQAVAVGQSQGYLPPEPREQEVAAQDSYCEGYCRGYSLGHSDGAVLRPEHGSLAASSR